MTTAIHSVFPICQSFGTAVIGWFEDVMRRAYDASSIVQDIEALNAVSDAELADKGLTREQATRNLVARYGYI